VKNCEGLKQTVQERVFLLAMTNKVKGVLLTLLLLAAQSVFGQTPITLPIDTLYTENFFTNPGPTGTTFPPGWMGYDENNAAVPSLVFNTNIFNVPPGQYNFGARIGYVGGGSFDTAYFVLALANTIDRLNFRLSFQLTAATLQGAAANMQLEYSTVSPNFGYIPLPATGLPYAGAGAPVFVNLQLPAIFNEYGGPIYIRWLYKRAPGGTGAGRGISLSNVRLRYDSKILNVKLGADKNVCGNGPIFLSSNSFPNASYLWNTGDTTQSISVSTSGTYSVFVTNPVGTGRDTVQVNFRSQPGNFTITPNAAFQLPDSGTINAPDRGCYNSTLTYDLSTPAGYNTVDYNTSWVFVVTVNEYTIGPVYSFRGSYHIQSPVGNSPARLLLTPIKDDGGVYYQILTQAQDLSTNCTERRERILRILPIPVTGMRPDTAFCLNGALNLFANAGFTSYLWSTGSTTRSTQISNPGQYWLEVNTTQGCTHRDTFRVAISRIDPVLPADTVICGPYVLDAKNPTTQVVWNTGQTTRQLLVTNSGTFVAQYTTTSGCEIYDSAKVTIFQQPTSQLAPTAVLCTNSILRLDTKYTGVANFTWRRNGNTIPENTSAIEVSSGGLYTVVVNTGNCIQLDTIQVTAVAPPAVNAGPDVIACNRAFIVPTTAAGMTYAWSNGTTTRNLEVDYSGNFVLSVTNAAGCTATDTVRVTILPPQVFAIKAPSTAQVGEFVDFDVLTQGGQVLSWDWNFGNGEYTNLFGTVYTIYRTPGTYRVRLVTNSDGCGFDTLYHTVVVSAATGIADEVSLQTNLYPNPTADYLNLGIAGESVREVRYQVMSALGAIVQAGSFTTSAGPHRINLADLPNGQYYLRAWAEGQKASTKAFSVLHD
jgi:hypothetical protein